MLDHNSRGKEMSLKNKFFAGVVAVSAFAVAGIAQDVKEPVKDGAVKAERGTRKFDGNRMRGGKDGHRGFRMGHHGMRGVDLTDAQKTQIKQIREANMPDASVREEMKTLMTAKRAKTATAEQEARLQTLRTERKAKAQSVHAQIQNVLTAEQKAQIEQNKLEMKTRMQEFREKRKAAKAAPAEVKKDN